MTSIALLLAVAAPTMQLGLGLTDQSSAPQVDDRSQGL